MENIVKLSSKERKEIFQEAAARKGMTSVIMEKDFWVCWVLKKIFADEYLNHKCGLKAIKAERTFWEKVTILHHEAHRPETSTVPLRYSRHYYDLFMLSRSDIKNSALKDIELLKNVVEFKKKFYPRGWARYDLAVPGTMKLIPPDNVLKFLRTDYREMRNMIFGEYPSFENIIQGLTMLEKEINL